MNQENKNMNSSQDSERKQINLVESAQSVKQSGDGVYLTQVEVVELIQKAKAEVLEKANKELAEEIKRTEEKVDQIVDDAKKEMATQIQMDKVALMSIFSIFTFVLSFLSIEFRFLQNIEGLPEILAFTLILCSLLLCFPVALDYLITGRMYAATDDEKVAANKRFRILLAIIGGLFVVGIIIYLCKSVIIPHSSTSSRFGEISDIVREVR